VKNEQKNTAATDKLIKAVRGSYGRVFSVSLNYSHFFQLTAAINVCKQ